MISTMAIDLAQRRVHDFQQRCGEYGEAALHLAYHAALPVALNAELLHLLRINFFLDPPEILPYTVEFEFLLSSLCREIDEGLYEIEPDIRDVLLASLSQTYPTQRTRDIATLLWQYVDHHSPWSDRVELERAQQLTALNFLNPEKAQQWLVTVETEVNQGQVAAREWFVAMRQDIENQTQRSQNEEAFTALVHVLNDQSSSVRHRAVEALGQIGNDKAVSALLNALNDTSSKVRLSAALALGQIGNDEAVNALLLTLQDVNSNVRSGAAKALGQLGSDKAVPALLKALKDRNRTVRSTAVEALTRIGHDTVIDALVDSAIDQLPDELPQNPEEQNQLGQNVLLASLRSLTTGEIWQIQDGFIRVGRDRAENDLVLQEDQSGISRQHAVIFGRQSQPDGNAETSYFLEDFSRFGTWISEPSSGSNNWRKVHRAEVPLPPGTQLKFGSSYNETLEFSVEEPETIREQVEALQQFQGNLEDGREAAAWLDENRTQLAETVGRLALEQFPDIKEAASPEQVDDYYFSIEQFFERISHCLIWGSYDILDDPEILLVFENKVYETAFRKIKKRLPSQLNDDAKEQLINCIDYLFTRVKETIEDEDQNKSFIPNEAALNELKSNIQLKPEPVQVFISYGYRDEVFRDQLVKHLSVLRRDGVISVWHDCCIQAGDEWAKQISTYLESADIILLLISADFIASSYCWDVEVTRAIERHDAGEARLIPILLRPVDLGDSPLSKLQVLPRDGKAITGWGSRDEAFLDVIQGIRRTAEQIMARSQSGFNQLSSPTNITEYTSKRGHLVHKLKVKDSTGRWAYYFVLIESELEQALLQALESNRSIDLEDYGKVIASCYGEEPDSHTKALLKERYGLIV